MSNALFTIQNVPIKWDSGGIEQASNVDLQYKMFLLNDKGRKRRFQKNIFTIQNVPIKLKSDAHIVWQCSNLQYKMFLLNNCNEITLFYR